MQFSKVIARSPDPDILFGFDDESNKLDCLTLGLRATKGKLI